MLVNLNLFNNILSQCGYPEGVFKIVMQHIRSGGCRTQEENHQEGPGDDEVLHHHQLCKGPILGVEACFLLSWCCNNHEAPPDSEKDAGSLEGIA